MPDPSNVIRTSIVAVGAEADLLVMAFARLGAKAEESRVAILVLSHVAVILSWNSLHARTVKVNLNVRVKSWYWESGGEGLTVTRQQIHRLPSADRETFRF